MKFPKNLLHTKHVRFGIASVAAVGLLVALPGTAQAAVSPVPLGTTSSFAVLAGQTLTNTGPTTVNGDVGVSPGPDVTGTETLTVNGATQVANPVALQAQADLKTAFDNAAGQTTATAIPTELGGSTLVPGIYSAGEFKINKVLTLDGGGDPNATFVFQSAAALTAASGSQVKLINGASPCNVFWLVKSSATLDTTADFTGTIMALTDVHLRTGATLQGRALARNGKVTLDANKVTKPNCSASTPVRTATPTPQVRQIPKGAVATGDGSTSAGVNGLGLFSGLLAFAGVGGAAVFATRRRRLNV